MTVNESLGELVKQDDATWARTQGTETIAPSAHGFHSNTRPASGNYCDSSLTALHVEHIQCGQQLGTRVNQDDTS